jgi:Putative restriction endonuclease
MMKELKQTQSQNFPIIPLLENGDRLTREEFHRRYEAMPKNVKTELIKGVVVSSNRVKSYHAEASAKIIGLLGFYSIKTFGLNLSNHVTWKFDKDNEFQPDCILRIEEDCGGKSWINDADYLEGSPELTVEIAAITASYDLHDKLEMYEQKSVQEYIVWRVLDKQIDWFSLENGKYQRLSANNRGIIESKVFTGLRLNVNALLNDDLTQVLQDLQSGITSKSHKEFVKNLVK